MYEYCTALVSVCEHNSRDHSIQNIIVDFRTKSYIVLHDFVDSLHSKALPQ